MASTRFSAIHQVRMPIHHAATRSVASWICSSGLVLRTAPFIRKSAHLDASNAGRRAYSIAFDGTPSNTSADASRSGDRKKRRASWTQEEVRKVVQLRESGLNNEQSSKQLPERSPGAVEAQWSKMSKGDDELAARVRTLIDGRDTRRNLTLSEEYRQQALHLLGQGMGPKAILKQLGLEMPLATFRSQLKSRSTKGRFSEDEDTLLRKCVQDGMKWSAIEKRFPGRSSDVLMQRWSKQLRPTAHTSRKDADEASTISREPWTIDEKLRLLQLYQDGKNRETIGRELSRSPEAVSQMLYNMHISSTSYKQDMEVLHRQRERLLLRKQQYSRGARISPEEIDQIRAMTQSGMKPVEIAYTLDRSLSVVKSYAIVLKTDRDIVTGHWTDQELSKVQILLETGATANDVAHTLGRSVKSVYCKIFRLQKRGLISKQPQKSPRVKRAELYGRA